MPSRSRTRSGDTVVAWRVDRLSRPLTDVLTPLAEYERELILERVTAGPRQHGTRFGRPVSNPDVIADKLAIAREPPRKGDARPKTPPASSAGAERLSTATSRPPLHAKHHNIGAPERRVAGAFVCSVLAAEFLGSASGDLTVSQTADRFAGVVGLAPAPRDFGMISGNRHGLRRYDPRLLRVFYLSGLLAMKSCAVWRHWLRVP